MTKSTLANHIIDLQNTLLSMEVDLNKRLKALQKDITQAHSADSEEQAVERENDEVIEKLIESSSDELALVRDALTRMAAGSYGVCQKCNSEISLQRLQALPYVNVCIECA